MLAIIGGSPARFAPFSQLFHQALERFGRAPLPVGVHSPGHVAVTDEQAREEFWPHYLEVIRRYSKIRGFAIPTKESFLHEVGPQGALYVGSPETVAQKIAANLTALGANRFDLKYGMGGLSHQALMTNIELYGTQVIPASANSCGVRDDQAAWWSEAAARFHAPSSTPEHRDTFSPAGPKNAPRGDYVSRRVTTDLPKSITARSARSGRAPVAVNPHRRSIHAGAAIAALPGGSGGIAVELPCRDSRALTVRATTVAPRGAPTAVPIRAVPRTGREPGRPGHARSPATTAATPKPPTRPGLPAGRPSATGRGPQPLAASSGSYRQCARDPGGPHAPHIQPLAQPLVDRERSWGRPTGWRVRRPTRSDEPRDALGRQRSSGGTVQVVKDLVNKSSCT